MKHHVHPETYEQSDSLDSRRYQLHTRRDICELTMCTFAEHYPEYQTKYVELARQLKLEIKQETARIDRERTAVGETMHERTAIFCAVCQELLTMHDIESGAVAEMFDPIDDSFVHSGIVHAECGLARGWEVS
jgi:hypothetical protein